MQTARAVPASTVVNLRDLGGIALGRDRRLRQGILLRSGQLSDFDAEHDIAVSALGLRTVVDLRTAEERAWAPDRLPRGARLFVADVFGDHPGVLQGRLKTLLCDLEAAAAALGGGKAEGLFAQTYRTMVLAPGAAAAYRAFLETAADPRARPLLFHCATGKDRTGWATALLLMMAGASREVVRAEFLAVNRMARRAFGAQVRRYLEAGGDPDIATAIIEVRPRYLDAALDAMNERWGGLDGYLRNGLRVPQTVVERLRADLAVTA